MPPASLPAMPGDEPGPHDRQEREQAAPPRKRAAKAQAAIDASSQRRRVPRPTRPARPAASRPRRATGHGPLGPARRVAAGAAARRRAATVSIASSTVTMPTSRPLVVDDRHGQQVVVGDDLGDLVLVGQDADGDRLVDHDLARSASLGRRDDEVAQREHADEPLVVVDDVDVVDRLGVGLQLAQAVDRLARRQLVAAWSRTRWS